MNENSDSGYNLQEGRVCIDFVNTVDWRGSDRPIEYLNTYADLVKWSQRKGILDGSQVETLLIEADRRPEEAQDVLERAIMFREAAYRILTAITSGGEPEKGDLASFNNELARSLAHSEITPSGEGYTWGWGAGEHLLDRMLWPVARDAGDFLTSGELNRIGKCADEKCGWLFLDTSRNRSRRWCSMEDCGNRAKARRHYQRQRTP